MTIRNVMAVVPLGLTAIVTGNERSNRPATHLAQPKYPGLVWQSNGNANLWAKGQFSAQSPVDFFAVLSANAQAGTTIRVRLGINETQVDGAALYDSGAVLFITPAITSIDGLYHSHLELDEAVSALWWRIDIGGHVGDFQAAAIIAGQKVSPSRFYDSGFEFGIDDLGDIGWSATGVQTEDLGIIHRTLGFRLNWVSQAEYETSFRRIVERLGKRGLSYWCFDPEPTAYRQRKTYLGWLKQLPTATQVRRAENYSIEFAIRSMI